MSDTEGHHYHVFAKQDWQGPQERWEVLGDLRTQAQAEAFAKVCADEGSVWDKVFLQACDSLPCRWDLDDGEIDAGSEWAVEDPDCPKLTYICKVFGERWE
jgi:hypothetical protein